MELRQRGALIKHPGGGGLASLPGSLCVKIGSVPKKRLLLKTRAIETLFGIKIYESISK
jgi:hypothetical protein